MPSHLHPRSTATSTLFAGTLLASFIVVGIPHVFPCPRPRKGYADSEVIFDADGKPYRRVRRISKISEDVKPVDDSTTSPANALLKEVERSASKSKRDPQISRTMEEEAVLLRQLQEEAVILEKERRECPVPKPRTLLGRVLGYQEKEGHQRHSQPSNLATRAVKWERD